MPELPDVQVFAEQARDAALNRTIETVSLRPEGMLEGTSDGTVRAALKGHRLTAARRHGKHLFLRSGEERRRWLRLHFGMTGELVVYERDAQDEPEHTRLRLDFRGGRSLAYRCPRKFGEIGLVEDPDAFLGERELGPDPGPGGSGPAGSGSRSFGLRDFREVLHGRTGALKPTLMNQRVLAGLGNIYTDEALFHAGFHPETPVGELSKDDVAGLWAAVRRVLDKAVEYRADPERMPRTWLLPNREEGAPCPRCDGTIVKREVGGRPTYLCDRHQAAG